MSPSCWWRMWACSAWLYWEDCWRLSGFLLTFGLCSFSLFWTFICSQFYTWESLRPVSCPSKPPKGIILGTPHCPVSYILQRLSVGQLTFYSFCTCSLVPTTSLSITYWVMGSVLGMDGHPSPKLFLTFSLFQKWKWLWNILTRSILLWLTYGISQLHDMSTSPLLSDFKVLEHANFFSYVTFRCLYSAWIMSLTSVNSFVLY